MTNIDDLFTIAEVGYSELTIDAETRTINVPSSEVLFGVESDEKAEIKHFRCPRFVREDADLRDFTLYINYQNANGDKGRYLVQDAIVSDDFITFDWLIGRSVVEYRGVIYFTVCAVKVGEAGLIETKWNTTLTRGSVLQGLEVDTSIVEEPLKDYLAQLEHELTQTGNSVVDQINSETSKGVAALEDKTTECLNKIPEDYMELDASYKQLSEEVSNGFDAINLNKVDGAYVENGYLFLTANGEVVVGDLGPFSGGGGTGGSGNNATLTLSNTSGWLSKTIAVGADCDVSFTWSSIEDGIATGNGIVTVSVDGVIKTTVNVAQGPISINIGKYVSVGANKVKVSVTDTYGNTRAINFAIKCVAISIESTFDASTPFTGAIVYTYVPTGAVNKTVKFELDGQLIGSVDTAISGRQLSFTIPAQPHGSHAFKAYFTAEIDGETVTSNVLNYDLICVVEGNTTPIIATAFNADTFSQYGTAAIEYYVYNPASMLSDIELLVDDEVISTQTVDRTLQTWSYRFDSVGSVALAIKCGDVYKRFNITVVNAGLDIEAETQDLTLYLSAYGRNNNQENLTKWAYGDIESILTGFNFKSDGWQLDENKDTVLRVAGDARVEIPLKLFKDDFRKTGKTIEVEFATRDVLNYDSVIISCLNDNRGIQYTTQMVKMVSEQSAISTQFKENEHIRLTFVVEKRSEHRLIYCYINGIMSGTVQYPDTDDFSQQNPVNITIGSNYCTLDIYCIRVYDNNLTRHQILNNWIADTRNIDDMLARYARNNIFDEYGNIVIDKLPSDLPYMILNAPELPQSKGDKKTISGSFVNPVEPTKSFTFEGAEFDVQGTSSAGYARKNYKGKFKGGFTLSSGEKVSKYSMRDNAIPTSTFTFKADVASSEGANNVELVKLYNDTCTYKTVPQQGNQHIRQGIDGFPMVVFWNNGVTTTFLGKYNFNNDKGTAEVYGFADGDESWEVRNNTSDRVLFKSDDFEGNDWLNDFEARYPKDNTDCVNLKALVSWVKSTDGNVEKFKAEFKDWFELKAMTYYYIFTEMFLMVDSRAKNMFPTKMGGSKWFILPYDFDTAIGINNEGALAFSYNLEDIDQVEGADVFNGQKSVLWQNFRVAFYDEIKDMYAKLRSGGVFSYNEVERRFEYHQAKWPEAIFNEDAYFKYIQPLFETGTSAYLSMLQGSKTEQRKWWLYNRFRYLDSKYNAGDSLSDIITLRGYAKNDITVTPYADIYASVKYGSYLVQQRAERNKTYTLACPLDNVNDTEIYIYNCSQILSIGDISGLMVGYAEFSLATKLSELKIGDASDSYSNPNLKELYLGNNVLLRKLDVRHCPNLTMPVDISGCSNIEEVYFDGTSVTGIQLPNGGILKKLHLPGTITNLSIINQTALTELVIPSYSNLTTVRLENVPKEVLDSIALLKSLAPNSRVRLVGFEHTVGSVAEIDAVYNIADTMRGLDEYGNNTEKAQLSGTIHIDSIDAGELDRLHSRYPDVTIAYRHLTVYLSFYNGGTLLYKQALTGGNDGEYTGSTPEKPEDESYIYEFIGWSNGEDDNTVDEGALLNVTTNRNVYACYRAYKKCILNYYNNGELFKTEQYIEGATPSAPADNPSREPDNYYTYAFAGWSKEDDGTVDDDAFSVITDNRNLYAVYNKTDRLYTVEFYNGDVLLQTSTHKYGETPTYNGSDPVYSADPDNFVFNGWDPAITSVTGNAVYRAKFRDTRSATIGFVQRTIASISTDIIEEVGYRAFSNCTGLTSIALPAAKSIGERAFHSCTSLASVSLPVATSIGSSAFQGCSGLTSVDLPVATRIGSSAFSSCSGLTSVGLPVATSIDGSAFSNCTSLTSVDLPAATTIRDSAFSGCRGLTSVDLPVATSISSSAFQNCRSLASVGLPAATEIGSSAFNACTSLTSVDLPAATKIDSNAFCGCANLVSLDLPVATTIGNAAFGSCNNLVAILLRNTEKVCTYTTTSASYDPSNANLKIYVPRALLEDYKVATNWSRLADKFVALEDHTVDGTTTGALREEE